MTPSPTLVRRMCLRYRRIERQVFNIPLRELEKLTPAVFAVLVSQTLAVWPEADFRRLMRFCDADFSHGVGAAMASPFLKK